MKVRKRANGKHTMSFDESYIMWGFWCWENSNFQKFQISSSESIKIQLWDTAQLEKWSSIPNSYYKYSDAAILVYSLNDIKTFKSLPQYILDIVENSPKCKYFYLCGNKNNLNASNQDDNLVTKRMLDNFITDCGNMKIKSYTLSTISPEKIKLNIEFESMFQDIAKDLNTSYRQSQVIQFNPALLKIIKDNPLYDKNETNNCNYC
ncbi:unnamed protein product [Gordionus sp. m RMFG-2023]